MGIDSILTSHDDDEWSLGTWEKKSGGDTDPVLVGWLRFKKEGKGKAIESMMEMGLQIV